MSLLFAESLSKSFGSEDVFQDISLSIPPQGRIGFVGPNGSGKTTLIKILIGQLEADSGTVNRSKRMTIGYLPQKIDIPFTQSAYEECRQVFSGLIAQQERVSQLEQMLADDPDNAVLLDEYGVCQRAFEENDGYHFENRIRQVLQGLGITDGEEHRRWNQLSGGQKTRAYLAKILLENPDLLVFDEPTNHLDLQAIEWLESFITDFKGAVLMVSHDRYFLDQTVNIIWELSPKFELYHGNYSAYLKQRVERYERQKAEYETQQEFIEKEESYIRKNIEGQNTRQAQGRRTRLERLLNEARVTRPKEKQQIHIRLEAEQRSGDLVLRTRNVKVGYSDDKKVLFSLPDLTLVRGECAAILGPNGVGKSTLIKTLLAELAPLNGEIELGANLKTGYFAQAHEKLHTKATLLDEIAAVEPGMLPAEIRSYLARFMFTGDDVYKKIAVLSGGEKGRLALAILALQKANLLLLDEPMNHLDVEAQEVLQAVLKEFNGTIILVSHDRYLVDAVATQIWEVSPEKKELIVYKGNYSEYKAWKNTRGNAELVERKSDPGTKVLPEKQTQPKKLSNNQMLRLEKKKRDLEEKITAIEAKLSEIAEKMNNPALDGQKIASLGIEYTKLEQELNQTIEKWSELEE